MEWLAVFVNELFQDIVDTAGVLWMYGEPYAIYFVQCARRLFWGLEGTSLDYIYQNFMEFYDRVTEDYYESIK